MFRKSKEPNLTLIPLVLTTVLAVSSAQAVAVNPNDYQRGLQRLQGNQARIDQALKQFGITPSGTSVSITDSQSEEKQPSLFQTHTALTQVQIQAGKLYFGKVFNRLVVGGDGSPAIVELDSDQGFASDLRVMGIARPSGTPGRVVIEVNRLLLRTGRTIPVQGTALDTDGALGLNAQVMSGKALAIGGAMASSFVSGLAASQQTETPNAFGFSQVQPTGRNALLHGVAQTAADQSKRLIDEATAEKPVFIVEVMTPVTLLIQEEVRW